MDQQFISSLVFNLIILPYFLIAITLAWYLPGQVISKNAFAGKSLIEKITLAIVIGMALWALQGVIFGYLQTRYLTYFYILIFLTIWFKNFKGVDLTKISFSKICGIFINNKIIFIIFILGIFGQIQQFIVSGFVFSKGIYMLTGSSDDAFWHTALINQLVTNFPPTQPGLSQAIVHNYHYISNLIVADLIRVFHLPLMPTQYQYIYVTLSILIGFTAYTLGRSLNLTKIGIIFLVYLQYFSSDIIYIFSFITKKVFEFGVHPLEDGTMLLENPPRAFASIFALTVVVLLIEFLKKKSVRIGLILSLVSGLIIGLKVHHGFLVLSGFFGLALFLTLKRQFSFLIYFFLASLISLLLYIPVNIGAGAPVFVLFDMARMFVGQEKIGLTHLELARQIYEQHGNTLQVWRIYLIMFTLFMIAEFGIKNIGFIPLKYIVKKIGIQVYLFILIGIVSTLVIGTFFIQPIAGADIFNFYLSASLFLGVLSAIILDKLLQSKNKLLLLLFILLIFLSTLPRWIYKTSTVKFYSELKSPIISNEELSAMAFIKSHTPTDSNILVFNSGQWDSMYPYVSAFTNRGMFLSGQVILGRHGIDFTNREKTVQKLMSLKNKNKFELELKKNNISHLYFYGNPYAIINIDSIPGKKIFYNKTVTIYKL